MIKYLISLTFSLVFFFTLSSACAADENPFALFFGEWTLKDNKFQRVLDGKTVEAFEIKNHRTSCKEINTKKVFSVSLTGVI